MSARISSLVPRRLHAVARAASVVGLFLVANACGGGGGGGGGGSAREYLFVADRLEVMSFTVVGATPTQLGQASIPGIPGTYSRAGNLVTVTMPKHQLTTGHQVPLDFSAGTGGTATDGTYVATVVDVDTFTVNDPASGAITGGTLLRDPFVHLAGTYVQAGTVVTITVPAHGLVASDGVVLDYQSGTAVDDDTFVATVPDANTFTVTADAAAATSGTVDVLVGANYTIFDMAMHPSGLWLYVTSGYDCAEGNPYCWAGDMISRFAIDWPTGGLAFEASYRSSDDPSAVANNPSPVTLVFSADGTRLFHQDDDLDGLRMWDVDPVTGDILLIASSGPGTTGQHGIAVSADLSRVYHGSKVFTVGPASLTLIPGGASGESNEIVGTTMFAILGGGQNAAIDAFSLANPDLPSVVAASPVTPHRARDLALKDDGALIVSSGFGGLKTYAYDGGSIVPAVGTGDTEFRDGGLPFPPLNATARVYRTVSLNAAEDVAAAAYFTSDQSASTGGIPPSGVLLLDVAADGSLSLLGDFPEGTYVRVARFLQEP